MLAGALLSACAQSPKLPEVQGDVHELPYRGPVKSTYWGALKSDPNWYIVEVQNKLFYIYGQAVRPSVHSAFLLENAVINPGDDVFDLGTGSGIQAIFAAQKARRVVATDIGPDAFKSAQFNVKQHGLESKIDVRQGDLFAPLKEGEQFDVIINNIEYSDDDPNSPLWEVHRRFFAEVQKYLKVGGRILYQSGAIANMPRVQQMAESNGLHIEEARMRHMIVQDRDLVYYVITRPPLPK